MQSGLLPAPDPLVSAIRQPTVSQMTSVKAADISTHAEKKSTEQETDNAVLQDSYLYDA